MRVLLLNPNFSWPCGVRDFANRLYHELLNIGIDAAVYRTLQRRLILCREISTFIQKHGIEVVHLQYPLASLRPSPIQHILPLYLRVPIIVTMHEYSGLNILRRLPMPALLAANKLIFTNEHELGKFRAGYPNCRQKTSMIPIGSNIPFITNSTNRDLRVISYFGLIRPNRGLDQFLDLAELSKRANRPYAFKILGAVPKRKDRYYRRMLERTLHAPNVQWKCNLDAPQVADELSMSGFAYLWYPDGASERRGSLLAAIGNGATIITRRGQQTPKSLDGVAVFSNSPEDALIMIDQIIMDSTMRASLQERASRWISNFTWNKIATEYRAAYTSLVENPRAVVAHE